MRSRCRGDGSIVHCDARGTGGTGPAVVLVMTTTEAVVPARSFYIARSFDAHDDRYALREPDPLEGRLDGGQQLEARAAVLLGDAP
jgi:hypothetical protein